MIEKIKEKNKIILDSTQKYNTIREKNKALGEFAGDVLEQFLNGKLTKLESDELKVSICEELVRINNEYKDPLIPPTAIDWVGNCLVKRILANEDKKHQQEINDTHKQCIKNSIQSYLNYGKSNE